MERYIIDTNVICDYFSASIGVVGMDFMDGVVDATPNISVIVKIELLCWKTKDSMEQLVNDFVNESIVLDINPEVVHYCVQIRRETNVKVPDAIIAATALAGGYTLITRNVKDFSDIQA